MFITENHVSFHFCWKKNSLNHQKVSKYYRHDWRPGITPAPKLVVDFFFKIFEKNQNKKIQNFDHLFTLTRERFTSYLTRIMETIPSLKGKVNTLQSQGVKTGNVDTGIQNLKTYGDEFKN